MEKQTPTINMLSKNLPNMPTALTTIVQQFIGYPTVVTVEADGIIVIPFIDTQGAFSIEWGDSTTENYTSGGGGIAHNYEVSGRFTIHITGIITQISFRGMRNLIELSQWGIMKLTSGMFMFDGCHNLQVTASDAPDLSRADNLFGMFLNCRKFNADISNWDISSALTTRDMFRGCESFAADLSDWKVDNVRDMTAMFAGCTEFNCDLSRWNVSNVEDFSYMFYECKAFNSDLRSWEVSGTSLIEDMFGG